MTVESIASLSTPMQASQIRVGKFCLIKEHPCKVVETSSSGTGKHGKCKINFVGIDIFTSKKYEHAMISDQTVEEPNVDVTEYQLINIDDGYLSLLDHNGQLRSDLKLPADQELCNKINKLFDQGKEVMLSVISAMGMEQVIHFKEMR
ncbi:hypothetical protein SAMD00019534_103980 [Acytostelium subglobosum LB1]|uniref:hypothetical protein n=1 Tax=Acytostelium subglobosum LB1 TaxID=1410327 RepID=UPI00064505EB|nr:hypothetical protein SAMD00019534_103980 [Acytostelium subglobosum LB1]GAM27223.1 hypothetical protein SAMD00019534_103980 [Acytostelium subglobosum LB1]|eukprot:XP_012749690.1 hypothetical protein SAMD00019534_103980 [Acytostelium subglobosum LB1]